MSEDALGERFHEIRRALNSAVLQLEVARIVSEGQGSPAKPLAEVKTQLGRLAEQIEALEQEVRP